MTNLSVNEGIAHLRRVQKSHKAFSKLIVRGGLTTPEACLEFAQKLTYGQKINAELATLVERDTFSAESAQILKTMILEHGLEISAIS